MRFFFVLVTSIISEQIFSYASYIIDNNYIPYSIFDLSNPLTLKTNYIKTFINKFSFLIKSYINKYLTPYIKYITHLLFYSYNQ